MEEKLKNFWHIDLFMKSAKGVIELSLIVEEALREWKETKKFSRFFFTHYIDENKKDFHIKIGIEEADKNKVEQVIKKLETQIKTKIPSEFGNIGKIQDVDKTDYGTGIPVDYVVCEAYDFYYFLKYKQKFDLEHRNFAIILERFIHHLSNNLLLPPVQMSVGGEIFVSHKILDFMYGKDKYR